MRIFIVLISLLSTFEVALAEGKELILRYNCYSCHSNFERKTGPSFRDISQRYGTSQRAVEKVANLIIKPNPSNWPGFAYMPPYNIPYTEALTLARYVLIDSQKEKQQKQTIESIPESENF